MMPVQRNSVGVGLHKVHQPIDGHFMEYKKERSRGCNSTARHTFILKYFPVHNYIQIVQSMSNMTRIAVHAGCLCFAKEAGSRLSKWRLCPIHTPPQQSAPLSFQKKALNCCSSIHSASPSFLTSSDSMLGAPVLPSALTRKQASFESNNIQVHPAYALNFNGYGFVYHVLLVRHSYTAFSSNNITLNPRILCFQDKNIKYEDCTRSIKARWRKFLLSQSSIVSGWDVRIKPSSFNPFDTPDSRIEPHFNIEPEPFPIIPRRVQKVKMWLRKMEKLDSVQIF
ncbi:hypothetical protein F5050DRAFT_461020 [Lentinula boryana]|uniref:Uncharacterized protein n=1 Tax=Lentinula boryana TaxID=40481 RepID=A0ABQ8Q7Y9_9AGAR|nr:hypothetical protein F5050DRAFT_461020 [Lentinula boryana]